MVEELTGNKQIATLALADGTIYRGVSGGAEGETTGEVVFNTSMSGYQEILTDPSYAKQMLTFTCPHIGNVGVNDEDVESSKVHASGLIVREICITPSNYRSKESLPSYLRRNNVLAISGIDTRSLVLHLRDNGSQMGIIKTGDVNDSALVEQARSLTSSEGEDMVPLVTCSEQYEWTQGAWTLDGEYKNFTSHELQSRPHVVALDFGVKYNILRLLTDVGFRVTVVPATTNADTIMALKPDGVFLSNGPGDPAAVVYGIQTTKELLGKVPMFGICLGHQILGLALGAPTFKLKFGHRGGNHPVRDLRSGKVEISVQNHGYATDSEKVPSGVEVSHVNLNDNTVEGLDVKELNAFSVQYHPECSPGPHDSSYLFKEFYQRVT